MTEIVSKFAQERIDAIKISILAKAKAGIREERYQFLRTGYFCLDADSTPKNLVFNRTVTLRDMWAKELKK